MDAATNEACSALTKAADDMACFYDLHQQAPPSYKLGDKVWLNAQNITTTRPMKKLDHKWLGPYKINKVVSRNAYGLELPASFGRTHPVFSVVLLRPYEEDPIVERHSLPPPPPIIRDGIQEYEVEKILDSRIFRGRLEYLVRWKGYGAAEDLWVPTQDVSGAKRLVREFHRLNPEAPQRISASLYAFSLHSQLSLGCNSVVSLLNSDVFILGTARRVTLVSMGNNLAHYYRCPD